MNKLILRVYLTASCKSTNKLMERDYLMKSTNCQNSNSHSPSKELTDNIVYLEQTLHINTASDILIRNFNIGKSKAYWIGINGLLANDVLQYIFSDLLDATNTLDEEVKDIEEFMNTRITYGQAELCDSWDKILKHILSGPSALFIDGFDKAIILDCRSYPGRNVNEPDTEIVTKGAKDSFTESLTSNTGLIRRRIRTCDLIFDRISIGTESKTDVSIGYISGKCDHTLVESVKNTLEQSSLSSITMGSQSVEEILLKKHWINPMPSMISSQRPDVVASYLSEGYICIVTDTSPYVLILPTTIFQYTQSPEDYYKTPAAGNYIRLIRFASILISLFLMPLFLLLVANQESLPKWLSGITGDNLSFVRTFIYILFIEFGLDLFKYSSAHSFSGFSNSLSIVGGLIIGEIATKLNWVSNEILFYEAITLLATLALPYVEFSDALRIYRMFLLIITGIGGFLNSANVGFVIGIIIMIISIATTPTFGGKSYFWPLFPFNAKAAKTLFFRYSTPSAQPARTWRETSGNN